MYDECGKHVGCLTPNDAAQYSVDTIDVPPGYVKVFDGDTYVGILTVTDYCEYLECTGQAPTPETITTLVSDGDPNEPTYTYTSEDATVIAFTIPNTVHIFGPINPSTGDPLNLSYNSTDGTDLTGDVFFVADRNGYTGAITIEINSADGIVFQNAAGTTIVMSAAGSSVSDEFTTLAPLVTGTYNITVDWKKADGTVMRTQNIEFIVP